MSGGWLLRDVNHFTEPFPGYLSTVFALTVVLINTETDL